MANSVLPCKYFNTPTGCRNGANCSFAHALSMKPPCRFFGSQVGCRFGDACMYSHDNEANRGSFAPRSRGRGRGGRGRFQSRGGMVPSSGSHDRQWYGDESDEENAPPPSTSKYKPESKLTDMTSFGLKPTPEGWEEYAAIQRAFKAHDEDVEMQDSGMEEMLRELHSFGLKPTPEGWDEFHAIKDEFERCRLESEMEHRGKGRGRGAATFNPDYDPNVPFRSRGRGGRGRGGF